MACERFEALCALARDPYPSTRRARRALLCLAHQGGSARSLLGDPAAVLQETLGAPRRIRVAPPGRKQLAAVDTGPPGAFSSARPNPSRSPELRLPLPASLIPGDPTWLTGGLPIASVLIAP